MVRAPAPCRFAADRSRRLALPSRNGANGDAWPGGTRRHQTGISVTPPPPHGPMPWVRRLRAIDSSTMLVESGQAVPTNGPRFLRALSAEWTVTMMQGRQMPRPRRDFLGVRVGVAAMVRAVDLGEHPALARRRGHLAQGEVPAAEPAPIWPGDSGRPFKALDAKELWMATWQRVSGQLAT